MEQHTIDINQGERFKFGENWQHFLSILDDARIKDAVKSLQDMLDLPTLEGKTFLDAGSGSGLFSLAARKLGARVFSFDYDPQSAACTSELRNRYFPGDPDWIVKEGSVLDSAFLNQIGQFDVVYSWGVLHHTGNMAQSFENIGKLVAPGGALFIAIYNDQGLTSKYWRLVKQAYNQNAIFRFLVILFHLPYLFGLRYLVRALTGRLKQERGMSLWYDMLDWLGGYPFEVARPEEVFDFFTKKGFRLCRLKTCGGRMGCNEFVFSS